MQLFAGPRPPRDLIESLVAHLGRRPKVLAWAATADGCLVGLADRLLVRDAAGWSEHPWHRIASGKWDGSTSRLVWVDSEQAEHSVVLDVPATFPDLFNERVSASVLFTRRVDLGAGRHVSLALRQDLATDATGADWQVTASSGVDLADPVVRARIDQELTEVAADFGIG